MNTQPKEFTTTVASLFSTFKNVNTSNIDVMDEFLISASANFEGPNKVLADTPIGRALGEWLLSKQDTIINVKSIQVTSNPDNFDCEFTIQDITFLVTTDTNDF